MLLCTVPRSVAASLLCSLLSALQSSALLCSPLCCSFSPASPRTCHPTAAQILAQQLRKQANAAKGRAPSSKNFKVDINDFFPKIGEKTSAVAAVAAAASVSAATLVAARKATPAAAARTDSPRRRTPGRTPGGSLRTPGGSLRTPGGSSLRTPGGSRSAQRSGGARAKVAFEPTPSASSSTLPTMTTTVERTPRKEVQISTTRVQTIGGAEVLHVSD